MDQQHETREQLLPPKPAVSSEARSLSESTPSSEDAGRPKGKETVSEKIVPKKRRGGLGVALLWKLEVLSMVVSTAALLSIIAVLFSFNGKSMSQWHAIIRPNTVISALSTLCKSSMLMVIGEGLGQLKWNHFENRPRRLMEFELFDTASRGPWGSATLLYHVNIRAWAASAGALLTILALAMDPFVQQVIYYDSRLVDVNNSTSTIQAARIYDMDSAWETSTDASSYTVYNNKRDTRIVGSLYKSIFGNYDPMPFQCPSGDCSWKKFESLGICNKCVDVTAQTNATQSCIDGEITQWKKLANRTCEYITPSGYRLRGHSMNWSFMRDNAKYHTLWNSTGLWDYRNKGSAPQNEGIATIAATKFGYYDDQKIMNHAIWLESAYECTMSWCAKEYDGTAAKAGSLVDEPSKETLLTSVRNANCSYIYTNGTTRNSTFGRYAFDKGSVWDPQANRTNDTFTFVTPWYKPADLPFINCSSTTRAQENGAAYQTLHTDPHAFLLNDQDSRNVAETLSSIFTTTFETTPRPGDYAARSLYQARDFAATMDQLARSMTDVIRTGPNATAVRGSVRFAEQHIFVRWEWMILPAALVLFSIAFLVTSVVAAKGSSAPAWKTSSTAALFHGLAGWGGDDLRSVEVQEMGKRAKEMRASLGLGEEGELKLTRAVNSR